MITQPNTLIEKISELASRRTIYVIAVLLGLLQAITFDFSFNGGFRWLAPVFSYLSLMGFLFILQHLSCKRAALFGYLFGLTTFGWGVNWIYISMVTYGGAPLAFAILANAVVVAYLAIYWALAGFFITFLGKTLNQRLLLAVPIIASLEWLRSIAFSGFPWLSIGYGWIDTPLSRLAGFGGVFFLTFVVLLLVVLPLLKLRRLHKNLLLIKVLVLIAIFSIPFFPLQESGQINVALIQGNMPVIIKYNTKRMIKNIVEYEKLSDDALNKNQKIDLIIWPEASIPFFYNDSLNLLKSIKIKQQQQHFDFISGVPYIDLETEEIYNSIFLQRERDELGQTQRYNKYHLLPFGEYLPLRTIFAFFEKFVTIQMADFTPGKSIQPPFTSHGITLAPAICFEGVFGNEVRKNARHAQVLLNISNDAWFGKSKAQIQHLNITRMRAIENQKMLIRATNNGLTVIVSPDGKVEKFLPPFKKGILTAVVKGYENLTLYARFGDTPWIILFLIFGLVVYLLPKFATNQENVKIQNDGTKTVKSK